MLVSIVPIQGVRLAEGAELDLGDAKLAEVTPALIDEQVAALREALERNNAFNGRAAELEAQLSATRRELDEFRNNPAVILREDRRPDFKTETDRMLLRAEDAIDSLRLALFLRGQWRFAMKRRARHSIVVGAVPTHGRREAHFVSQAGWGMDSSWEAIPVHIGASEPQLEELLRQLDAAAAARNKTQRAYRLLSDALETTRLENFLVWAAFALEVLLLGDEAGEKEYRLALRTLCLTGDAKAFQITQNLYKLRSSVVHGGKKIRPSPEELLPDGVHLLQQAFAWSLEQLDPTELEANCRNRLAAVVRAKAKDRE